MKTICTEIWKPVTILLILFQCRFKLFGKQYFVMNMSEKIEELDIEPDVLQFKRVWDQLKEVHKEKPAIAVPSHQGKTIPRQQKQVKQIKQADKEVGRGKQKSKKKEAVLSSKNVQRNPKFNPEAVIEVVTNPLGFNQNQFENQKNNINKETLLQHSYSENQGKVSDIRNLERELDKKDHELSLLRVNNTRNEDRIRVLESEISLRDKKIFELESRQRDLVSKVSSGLDQERLFDYGKVQYENFRNDSKRLLKMLQNTSEYQTFANLALDDNGVRFLHTVNQKIKSQLDSSSRIRLHFCTCNKDFIPESSFWVPEKIYSYGKDFVKERNGELTGPELELLLYDLNKFWREREKRIINTITSQKSKQIEQLKRKLALQKRSPQE